MATDSTQCTFLAFPNTFCPFEVSSLPASFLNNEKGIHTSYRYHRYYSLIQVGTWFASWDFVSPTTMDYLFIGRLDCTNNLFEVILSSSDDDIVYTAEQTFTAPFTLTGPRDEDFFQSFTETTAHRYWRVSLTMVPTAQVCFSKIYMGNLFDMGIEPTVKLKETHTNRRSYTPFRTTNSRVKRTRTQHPSYEFTLAYEGVSNSVLQDFMNTVSFRDQRFVLLINQSYTELLNNHEVVHGILDDPAIERASENTNELTFKIKEMVG